MTGVDVGAALLAAPEVFTEGPGAANLDVGDTHVMAETATAAGA